MTTRVDLALLGIRGRPPVSRTAGAGPSDDGHLVIDGLNAAIPQNPMSPFVFDGEPVLLDGEDTGLDVEVIERPRFYDLPTADGVAYEKLARLHGRQRAGHHRRTDVHPLRRRPALPVLLDRGVAAVGRDDRGQAARRAGRGRRGRGPPRRRHADGDDDGHLGGQRPRAHGIWPGACER